MISHRGEVVNRSPMVPRGGVHTHKGVCSHAMHTHTHSHSFLPLAPPVPLFSPPSCTQTHRQALNPRQGQESSSRACCKATD